MSVQTALRAGRTAAERRMLDTCEIRYQTGETTFDETNGRTVPVYATRFTTKCRVSVGRGLAVRESNVGGRTAAEVTRDLCIPVDSPAVFPGDEARMLTVHSTSDPTLAGATLTLAGAAPGSQTTQRRLQVSEVIS